MRFQTSHNYAGMFFILHTTITGFTHTCWRHVSGIPPIERTTESRPAWLCIPGIICHDLIQTRTFRRKCRWNMANDVHLISSLRALTAMILSAAGSVMTRQEGWECFWLSQWREKKGRWHGDWRDSDCRCCFLLQPRLTPLCGCTCIRSVCCCTRL